MKRHSSFVIRHSLFTVDWGLLAALVVPLLALLPLLLYAGLPNTADGPVHLMRQVQLNRAWSEGNFYPRWGTDLALGHGMPIFSYAPPLLYQATQLFHLSGLPLDASMKGVVLLDFLLYSAGMFLFARRVYGPYPALVAAAMYTYAPYRLREAFIQGNYGQFSGLAFYPLIFWAFHDLLTEGRARYWLAAPLALAGLLFSHNISFMLFAPLLAAYLLFLIGLMAWQGNKGAGEQGSRVQGNGLTDEGGRRKTQVTDTQHAARNTSPATRYPLPATTSKSAILFLRATIAGLLGLGLSAIFWLPAFGERHDIKLEGITQGFFDFRENFISLPELLSLPLPLDRAAINPEFPLALGPAQLIGAVLGLMFVMGFLLSGVRGKEAELQADTQHATRNTPPVTRHSSFVIRHSQLAHALFFAAFLLLYTFLALPASQPVWEAVPLLELTEFPWRMLGPAVFCAAGLSAAGWTLVLRITCYVFKHPLPTNDNRSKNAPQPAVLLTTTTAVLLVIALNAPYLYSDQFIPWGTPTPAEGFAYEAASGAIGTTSTGEFLPRWAQQHPQPETLWPDYAANRPPQKLDPATLPPGATVTTLAHRSESDLLDIDTPQPFTATLRTLYWPGWQVTLSGQPVPFEITPNTGLIRVEVPAGQHTLGLKLASTPLRSAGLWLSLLSLAGLAAVGSLAAGLQRRKVAKSPGRWLAGETARYSHYVLRFPFYERPSSFHLPPSSFILLFVALIALALLSRPLKPLFTLQSNPDAPAPADLHPAADFADQIRLVGADSWPQVIELPAAGEAGLTVTLYWRALQDLDTNYAVFLHLDAPNGQTLATVDEVNPESIPTANWPPGLYLRNPLHLRLPANLPPIRYTLTTGVYNRATGERLPLADGSDTAYPLGSIWLDAPPPLVSGSPLATFGDAISLHRAAPGGDTMRLVWRTARPIERDLSIFVHVLDSDGNLLAQADGVPFDGLYPLPNWRPGQLIPDERSLTLPAEAAAIAIGLYDPATGQRLPAVDVAGHPLSDDSFTVEVR